MSCLFRSLSYFINNTNENQLRQIIVEYLEKDPILIQPDKKASEIIRSEFPSDTLQFYVEKMKRSSTWGGAIEIKAFCELFSMQVGVLVLESKKEITFVPSSWDTSICTVNKNRFLKISWNGYHYEPLKEG